MMPAQSGHSKSTRGAPENVPGTLTSNILFTPPYPVKQALLISPHLQRS